MKLNSSEKQILKVINGHSGISRKELSEKSHLSLSSITNITKMLIEHKFIIEGERISNGVGRNEVLLYTNPSKFKYMAVDIGGYKIRITLSDNNLNIINQTEILMSQFNEAHNKIETLIHYLDQYLIDTRIKKDEIDAIGIGVTGIIDQNAEMILNIPNANEWDDLPIVSLFKSHFKCPIFLEESGRTMAIAEKIAGKARDIDDFIAIQIGFGLVAGIMINGNLLRGAQNVAGLLGHTTVDEKGERCLCGNFGCLENIITFPMLEQAYFRLGGKHPSYFLSAYQSNQKIALDVCIMAGEALGIALSNVVNLFNPNAIYIGGPVIDKIPFILEETKRTVLLRANRFATTTLEIAKNSYGDMQGIFGTLAMAKTALIE